MGTVLITASLHADHRNVEIIQTINYRTVRWTSWFSLITVSILVVMIGKAVPHHHDCTTLQGLTAKYETFDQEFHA